MHLHKTRHNNAQPGKSSRDNMRETRGEQTPPELSTLSFAKWPRERPAPTTRSLWPQWLLAGTCGEADTRQLVRDLARDPQRHFCHPKKRGQRGLHRLERCVQPSSLCVK